MGPLHPAPPSSSWDLPAGPRIFSVRTSVLTSSGCSTRISSATSGTGEEPPPGWIPPPHSMAGEPLARLLLAARSFLRSDILATPLWQLYRPSTGAVMLLAAIHTCDEVGSPCTAPLRWCPVIRGWAHGTGHKAHGTAPCPQLLPPEAYPRPFCTRASSPSPSLLVSPSWSSCGVLTPAPGTVTMLIAMSRR